MKKLLLILAVLLLSGAGYFTYEKWVKHSDLTAWHFIPSDAAMVFEVEVLKDYQALEKFNAWKSLNETPGVLQLKKGLSFLDSINGTGGFTAIFKDAPVLISMHKISDDDFDFLFVQTIQNISQNTFVGATINRLKDQGYRFKTRNYNGFNISEISKGGKIFTCIFYKNYLLASFTPYLVEDAIRTISDDDLRSYEEVHLTVAEPTTDGLFNTYINYEKSSDILSGLIDSAGDFPLKNGNYTFSMDSSYITVSGFSYAEKGWFTTHIRQPSTFEMAEIIPENTAFVYHITSTDMAHWKDKQLLYLEINEPKAFKYSDSLRTLVDFNASQVLDLIEDEIGIVNIESSPIDPRRFCILEVKDVNESLTFFEQLTERVALSRGDSVYTESYSDNEIRFLPIKNFPQTFLGDLAGDFDQCFYLSYRNWLIFSNNLQELKSLINSIENENTWGKSLHLNEFLDHTNNSANVSLFINIPRSWNLIDGQVRSGWKDHFKDNMRAYKSFELAAFQFSYLDNRFFTNFTFSQPELRSKNIPKTRPESDLRFASKLITKPFLVRTHAHKEFDIIVQDSTHTIYYLDKEQNAQWTEELHSEIVSDVFPIDYYKNGKLQYVFATTDSIHMLDRTGEYIPGYPKTLPNQPTISNFNLIDYDRSRNYRMAVTDNDGNVYLTDKDLKPLDGWKPRKFNRRQLTPLDHTRIGRTDIMITLQENGIINLTNRRGDQMKGFPFDTKETLDQNYYLRTSNGLSNSTLSVISNGGELTEMSLEGLVVKREQLIKTQADAQFQLIPDRGGSSFLIVRKEGNSYEVLDDTGNLLFKKDYLSNEPILIQYYQFGAGKDLVIFTDTANQSLYIYDKSGNLVTGNPLNSANEVSILYSSAKREFQVFSTWGANLELYTFSY